MAENRSPALAPGMRRAVRAQAVRRQTVGGRYRRDGVVGDAVDGAVGQKEQPRFLGVRSDQQVDVRGRAGKDAVDRAFRDRSPSTVGAHGR